MKINSKDELNKILDMCKAKPYSDIKEGGNFYKIKSQDFVFPDGSIQTREYIDKRKSSVVVPVTTQGNILFIIQPIALSNEGVLLEFPAGYYEFNENGIEAGIRELAEETGYVAANIIPLGSHYQDPGSIRQSVESYLALNCIKLKEQKLDKGEYIKYIEVPYQFAKELFNDGYIMDSNSFIAFSKSCNYLEKVYKKDINKTR